MSEVSYSSDMPVPKKMNAWVLKNPEELVQIIKPVPVPGKAEVLVRIDAIAICATDLEVIKYGTPALIEGGDPFNKSHPARFGPTQSLIESYRALQCLMKTYKDS